MDRHTHRYQSRSYRDSSRDKDHHDSRKSSSHHRSADRFRHHGDSQSRDRTHREYSSTSHHSRSRAQNHQSTSNVQQSDHPYQPCPPATQSSIVPQNFQPFVFIQQTSQPPPMTGTCNFQDYNFQNLASNDSNWQSLPTRNQHNSSLPLPPDPRTFSINALETLNLPKDKITDKGIIPDAPYYELPAGLMVPLVPSHEREYKPLNHTDLRLPLPKFPDEQFLKLIDSFYRPDSKARDNDGWNRDFIDTYLKQKEALAEMLQSCNK